ncbi:hypothetical protein B0H12DRAFT_1218168 [Mycena haematopus]|nr:hypothetical protein B0H12DRAFT_1218168 [Mycena haematopus]
MSSTVNVGTVPTDETTGAIDAGARGSTATSSMRSLGYKGKALRSWHQLPPEVIRLIATYHLYVVDANGPLPMAWDVMNVQRQRWGEHMVYIATRDTHSMEVLMSVCPQWGLAVEHHPFWNTAIQLFDPHNLCAHFAWTNTSNNSSSAAQRVSPYRHFRHIYNCTCIPCRINAPRTSHGLGAARRVVSSLRLATVNLCKDHADPRRMRYCGVCFLDGATAARIKADAVRAAELDRDRASHAYNQARMHAAAAPPHAHAHAALLVDAARTAAEQAHARVLRAEAEEVAARAAGAAAGVVETEDETVFPSVASVCRSCRAEWLWRYALLSARVVREPIGFSMGLPIPMSTTASGAPYVDVVLGKGETRPRDEGEPLGEERWERERGAELLGALGVHGAKPGLFWPEDAVVKAAVSAFLELGEGTINHVLVVAGERGWLRAQTRWAELMKQAMAAKRWGEGTTAQAAPAYPQTVLVTRADRERYANNAANIAAYARAGYTPSSYSDEHYDYSCDEDSDLDEEDDEFEEELEDEDGDEEEGAAALEMTVKEMALTDWARARVLDGAWLAPADVYYNLRVPGIDESTIRAIHPVAWSVSPPSSPPHPSPTTSTSSTTTSPALPAAPAPPATHPGPAHPPPPTYALAEAAHNAHMRQVRAVLLPAFQNVVRRVVVECALDAAEGGGVGGGEGGNGETGGGGGVHGGGGGADPAMRAAKMTLGEVVRQVREEEGVWFDGMDWGARRRNARREREGEPERERDRERDREREQEGSSDSGTPRTTTSTSDNDTSPVLSTSTLGTTPSPPPLEMKMPAMPTKTTTTTSNTKTPTKTTTKREMEHPTPTPTLTIPVAPVRDPPRLLRPIPYVPETIAHLPQYSLEALRSVWREACEPLYHCRCRVCERAMGVQMGKGAESGSGAGRDEKDAKERERDRERERAREREREKDVAAPGDGPWVMHIPSEEDDVGADSVIKLVEEDDAWDRERDMEVVGGGGRRKWHAEDGAEGEDEEDGDEYEEEEGRGGGEFKLYPAPAAWGTAGRKRSVDELEVEVEERGGTPPKRARTAETQHPQLAKRRSEELDVDADDTGSVKRARVGSVGDSPPDTTSASGDSVH